MGAYELTDYKKSEIAASTRPEKAEYLPFNYGLIKEFGIPNLALTTDCRGVRGSSMFAKENKKHMSKLKDAGIKCIIDLRNESNIAKAKKFCNLNGMEYIFFPVKYDEKITQEDLDRFPIFIEAMNKGNYYIGCVEGTNRTDVAIGLNYLFNPKCNIVPEFRSSVPQKSLSMLGKAGNEIIGRTQRFKKEYTITEEFVQKLGWKNLDDFFKEYNKRMKQISQKNLER